MRRNSLKLTALAAMAFAGGAVGLNCSKNGNPTGTSGDIKLAVVLPSGSTLTTINYKILSSSSAQLAGGSFNVSDPNATISLDIVVPVTPIGDAGDTVSLTATSSTGESCTGTSAAFPVLAGTNPAVTMSLTCGTGTAPGQTGNIGVTATVVEGDVCPSITSAVVGPDETSVGSSAMVIATATGTSALTYAWAPAANFTTPSSAGSSYKCLVSGLQTFTLTVSDSHTPPCQTTATLTIKCDGGPVCGNGVVEAGETCDPPNGTTCSATCQTIGGTGGMGVAGSTGTGGTGTGGVAGTTGTGGTGTGGVAGTTGTGGVAGTTGTGGTGTGGVAGTTGTGGTGTGGMMATGGTTGTGGAFAQDNASCVSCETTGTNNGVCFTTSTPGATTVGCDGFTNAADKANCLALLGCLRSTACQSVIHAAGSDYGEGTAFDDGTPCLCNNATTTVLKNACLGQTAWTTGICASQFVAASNNAAGNSTPVASLYDPAYPVGVAMNLMTCDIDTSASGSGTPSCATAQTCQVPQ